MIDEEVKLIVDAAHERTVALLREHRDKVEIVAQLLLKQEKITAEDVAAAIGERPFDNQYKSGFVVGKTGVKSEEESVPETEVEDEEAEEEDMSSQGIPPAMVATTT